VCREVLDGAGARLAADAPAIGVHEPGDVYARDDFVYWGFSPAASTSTYRSPPTREESLFDDGAFVATFREFVDLAGHGVFDDGQQAGGVEVDGAVFGAADV
jgi:hypothetical protein